MKDQETSAIYAWISAQSANAPLRTNSWVRDVARADPTICYAGYDKGKEEGDKGNGLGTWHRCDEMSLEVLNRDVA